MVGFFGYDSLVGIYIYFFWVCCRFWNGFRIFLFCIIYLLFLDVIFNFFYVVFVGLIKG